MTTVEAGHARMATMTRDELSQFQSDAAKARWRKSRKKKQAQLNPNADESQFDAILQTPIVGQLEKLISALKPRIAQLRQELSQRQRELSALEVARRRLCYTEDSSPEPENRVLIGAERSGFVRTRPTSVPSAARAILRERGIQCE
jgi:hypothetical protein